MKKKYNLTSRDRISRSLRSKLGVTKERMIEKYGLQEGCERWDTYLTKQAETNTFEYKHKKYGWTRDQFDEYNRNRACTLSNFISRHGTELGMSKWEEYKQLQAYAGSSEEYFIKKYGAIIGSKKWATVKQQKILAQNTFIRKYGEIEGLNRWNEYLLKRRQPSSEVACIFFEQLFDRLSTRVNHECFFKPKTVEYFLSNKEGVIFVDFYDKSTNRVIEFYGDYWHANPAIYKAEWLNPTIKIQAQDIHIRDNERARKIIESFKKELLILWERDIRINREQQIERCINFLINGA